MSDAHSESEPSSEDEEPDDLWEKRAYASRWSPTMEDEEDAGNPTD